MDWFNIFFIGIGLSMDAFAVSVCKGLAMPRLQFRHMLIVGAWFGGFQALMPALGYLLGSTFASYIDHIDHWVAFVLLALIGANMIKESFDSEQENADASLHWKAMALLAVATSIDALAVGITFAFEMPWFSMLCAVLCIGVITFLISAAGVKIGNVFGAAHQKKAERIGGVILILIGLKILLEGLGVIAV